MQCTQRKNTIGTYRKLRRLIGEAMPVERRILDYGAGHCLGALHLKAHSLEPNPREGVEPDFRYPWEVSTHSFHFVVCNCVLNVVDTWEERVEIINQIVRILRPGGSAYILVRRHTDVADIKHKKEEGDGWRLDNGAFQRGYTYEELKAFLAPFGEIERIPGVHSIGICLTTPAE